MKLSKILYECIVIPTSYDTIVGFLLDQERLELSWTNDEGLEFTVECNDQDVEIMDQGSCRGMFAITDDEDNVVQFIALKEALLEG